MFLKLIGMAFIIGASSLIGFKLANILEYRLIDLRKLQLMLQVLEKEMVFMQNSLPNSLIAASKIKGNVSDIFRSCGEILIKKQGYCVDEAWQISINKYFVQTFLNEEDKEILFNLGKCMGAYDIENQIQNIRLISSQLKVQEKKAQDLITNNVKMYKNLGILSGLAVAIIML